jgi:ribonuclease-3
MASFDNRVTAEWPRVEERLGYHFVDRQLLAEALTHRSYANEQHSEELPDNERLEFLGDAVLDLVVSEYIMAELPQAPEGELTRVRSEVVSAEGLARVASSFNLGAALLLGRGEHQSGGREKPNLLADALEALLGALFTEAGYAGARTVILPHFAPLLRLAAQANDQDFKSRLQEVLQARGHALPLYRLVSESGPPHEPLYRVEVLVEERVSGTGLGRSKKRAEQAAAREALFSYNDGL